MRASLTGWRIINVALLVVGFLGPWVPDGCSESDTISGITVAWFTLAYAVESLAELLLQSNDGWYRKRLEHEIATGQTRTVKLNQPIPVLLMYFTAEAREDSVILFRKDLYHRDASLVDALNQPLSNNAVIDMPVWYQ